MHRELKRKHVTLSIPLDDYIDQHPDGFRHPLLRVVPFGEGELHVTMRRRIWLPAGLNSAMDVGPLLPGQIRKTS
jgi:hypothetical protein